jgi:hypothetical protein
MIFLGGSGAMFVAEKQRVATEKISQNRKHAKKDAKISPVAALFRLRNSSLATLARAPRARRFRNSCK